MKVRTLLRERRDDLNVRQASVRPRLNHPPIIIQARSQANTIQPPARRVFACLLFVLIRSSLAGKNTGHNLATKCNTKPKCTNNTPSASRSICGRKLSKRFAAPENLRSKSRAIVSKSALSHAAAKHTADLTARMFGSFFGSYSTFQSEESMEQGLSHSTSFKDSTRASRVVNLTASASDCGTRDGDALEYGFETLQLASPSSSSQRGTG